MSRYVIDAPTLVHLIDAGLVPSSGHQLVAPSSIRSEALEVLLLGVRRGDRTEKAALQSHEQMTGVRIRLLGDRVSRRVAWQIALAQGWDTLRDAEYLAITRLQADALVTVDADLAAKAAGLVSLAGLDALIAD